MAHVNNKSFFFPLLHRKLTRIAMLMKEYHNGSMLKKYSLYLQTIKISSLNVVVRFKKKQEAKPREAKPSQEKPSQVKKSQVKSRREKPS